MPIELHPSLPLVVFCNKCDLRSGETGTDTLSLEEVEAALSKRRRNLATLMGVFDTSSFESEGIEAALESLVQKGSTSCDVHNSFRFVNLPQSTLSTLPVWTS